MEIVRADILGFCAGVRRAVSSAEKALSERTPSSSGTVYTFGPLIHNPVALSELAERGLEVLESTAISSLTPVDTVLIRAHGVPPVTDSALRATGAAVINATCPLVTQSQKRAADFARKGYTIIFAGDKNHGEVIGIQGYAEEAARNQGYDFRFLLVRSAEEAAALCVPDGPLSARPCVLLSQTTFSIKEFERISEKLKAFIPGLEIYSSICPATHERQDALRRLCAQVEGVLVIGGKNSSNTNRLFTTAEKLCRHAALIETASEIPPEFFELERVGITAGASTPDSVIAAVEERLKENGRR
ncbi:MAG: 4-hydroxy-3-methylbut-2-enyl diphosphate reductase [Treponema sp.]|nr:4-hydroxy-3-methylbut-2-enyl diphosphate reductase [Treponema sp.]